MSHSSPSTHRNAESFRLSGRRAPAVESKAGSRKPRQVKVYKNPHTGEVVETKGGNHKTLKEWKAEHGSATVESWLTK
ncbi:hypothetical protein PS914_05737 [Pseudomonas fluorescens]|jgi:hypothetical protein|nr:hypothetical protein PS914_05737 [Pseudomonas fluorescens]